MRRIATLIVALVLGVVCEAQTNNSITFDFEHDLGEWSITGDAFRSLRGSESRTDAVRIVTIGGDYWKHLSYPLGQHGDFMLTSGDIGTGELTSKPFVLFGSNLQLNVLIGGTPDPVNERFELQVLTTSPEDAAELRTQVQSWSLPDTQFTKPLTTDGDFVVVLAATPVNVSDKAATELLRQKSVKLPSFLANRNLRVKILDKSQSAHINIDYIRFADNNVEFNPPVWGYADYHTHVMSNLAFGALKGVNLLWGCPGGSYQSYVEHPELVGQDIPRCIKNHGGAVGAEVFINASEKRINLDGSPFRLIWDLITRRVTHHKSRGGPEFTNYPTFLSGAHQQMHITQIRRNYDGGLRLLAALAVHNLGAEYLSSKTKDGNIFPSTEWDVARAEIAGIKQLVRLNSDWMEIAYSPAQARDIIRKNKLAIILGIEVDRLGELDPANPKSKVGGSKEIDELWSLGIRAVTPIHAVNNWIGSPAVFFNTYNALNDFLNRHDSINNHLYNVRAADLKHVSPQFFDVREGCPESSVETDCVRFRLDEEQNRLVLFKFPFLRSFAFLSKVKTNKYANDHFLGHKNLTGLTPYGQDYIGGLMDRGMIIDIAHMGEKSIQDVYGLVQARVTKKNSRCRDLRFTSEDDAWCLGQAYPMIISHAHFRAHSFYGLSTRVEDSLPSEYQISDRTIEMVRSVSGVIGPFVSERPLRIPDTQKPPPFDNDCAMSSKGFGISFRYGSQIMNDRGVGMATDFTFIPGVAPRFGKNACWGYNLADRPKSEKHENPSFYRTAEQKNGVVYEGMSSPGVKIGNQEPLKPYRMGVREKPFDFNIEGLAHYGLVPDMLQDLKNVGMSTSDFETLFSSAEGYIEMWEKAWRLSGCDEPGSKCNLQPTLMSESVRFVCPLPVRKM